MDSPYTSYKNVLFVCLSDCLKTLTLKGHFVSALIGKKKLDERKEGREKQMAMQE